MIVPSDTSIVNLPPELLETPQPVIGFSGLDCSNNLVHKSIWDAFNTNRKSDRYDLSLSMKKKSFSSKFMIFSELRFSLNYCHRTTNFLW